MSDRAALTQRLRAAGCVYAEREAELITTAFAVGPDRERAVERRERGEPLEYVVGWARFGPVQVAIGAPGFIPRARALALVEACDHVVDDTDRTLTVLDLGCGVGAIAAALAHRHPGWEVHASDVDVEALGRARHNGATYGFSVHAGSWFAALPADLRGRLDVVVAHLPYVPSGEIERLPRDFRDHEARHTVDGGADGLDPLREVARACSPWLKPDGTLLTHVSSTQRDAAERVAREAGLTCDVVALDADPHDDEEDAEILALRPQDVRR